MKIKAYREFKPRQGTVEVVVYHREDDGEVKGTTFELPYEFFLAYGNQYGSSLLIEFPVSNGYMELINDLKEYRERP